MIDCVISKIYEYSHKGCLYRACHDPAMPMYENAPTCRCMFKH